MIGATMDRSAESDVRSPSAPPDHSGWLKLSLLAHGMSMTKDFARWFSSANRLVKRRNFYNSPGLKTSVSPPQELRLGGAQGLVVAVNDYGPTPWSLGLDSEGEPTLTNLSGWSDRVHLISDLEAIQRSAEVANDCNLYGGSALSFFSPRACYFFSDGFECAFCSLGSASQETSTYASRLDPASVRSAIVKAMGQDADRVNQIMIVGGNARNLDRGFVHHLELVNAAFDGLAISGHTEIPVHLVTMPPKNLALIEELAGLPGLHVGFNLEVWDPETFERLAPGKARDYGQPEILDALLKLRDTVGAYRAHSILIAGLEEVSSTLAGALHLASNGISPIINIFHSDRGSKLGVGQRPTYAQLITVAQGVQSIHDQYPVLPYWDGCGRNSIDYEASIGLFRSRPVSFGARE